MSGKGEKGGLTTGITKLYVKKNGYQHSEHQQSEASHVSMQRGKIGNEKATVISTSVSMPKTTTVICVVNCGHDLEI